MPSINFGIIIVLFLSVKICNFQAVNKDDVSFNYEFDYQTNVETKNSSGDYVPVISYIGKIETSSYLLTDKQELLLLKFNVYGTGRFLNETNSITSIVIRNVGLAEKIIVGESVPIGMLNLLKGVVNLMNIDEMRENKTEHDISGECFVKYETVNDHIFRKEKSQCNTSFVLSSTDNKVDSFSLYRESGINIYYVYNNDGALISIKSVETHSIEPVLFHNLIQDYKSVTTITFKKLTKSLSMISSKSLNDVIRIIFGNNYQEIFLISTPEFVNYLPTNSEEFFHQIKSLTSSKQKISPSQITIKLIKIFRQITEKFVLHDLMKMKFSKEIREILTDALINCGTKFCYEVTLSELEKISKEDELEAHRILLLIQNIRAPKIFIIKNLWKNIQNLTGYLYDQAIQTLTSLLENSPDNVNLEPVKEEIVNFIKKQISACDNEHCFLVHLNAIKNSRLGNFREILFEFFEKSGNYSSKIVANAFNTFWVLKLNESNGNLIKEKIFKLISNKINFFDPLVQYHSIYCLVMLQIDTYKLIGVLNEMNLNNTHFQYFLMTKLKELINLGIVKDFNLLLESKYFQNLQHMFLTYSEEHGSKVYIKPLFATENSLIDIHFNIIGSDGGIIKHSMTDLFIVSTANENNVFSLSTHMSGLGAFAGTNENNEEIEGILQLALFGKEIRPYILFQGTTDLMSAVWNAPTSLKSILRGSFVPIDSQNEIIFQNGIFMMVNYIGSVDLDFSFQMNSNLWYKTAETLLRTTGNAFVTINSKLKSINQSSESINNLFIKTGIDFETNTNFGNSPVRNCLSILSPVSTMNVKSTIALNDNSIILDHSNQFLNLPGKCYSITQKMNQVCSEF